MKILFDQGTPVPLRRYLPGHAETAVYELGWQVMANGELLQAAGAVGYGLSLITDQNLRHPWSCEPFGLPYPGRCWATSRSASQARPMGRACRAGWFGARWVSSLAQAASSSRAEG